MHPSEFLRVAVDLARVNGSAECRTAISRAYYALFNTADLFLEELGIAKPKRDRHQVFPRMLLNSGDADIVEVGSAMSDLHQQRLDADYHLHKPYPENPKNVEAVIQEATRLIGMLNSCPSGSPRWLKIQASIGKVQY